MTKFTPTLSKQVLGSTLQVLLFALLLAGFGASAALAQTRAYVTNNNDDTVSVIDTATNSVIATVPVGASPAGVAVTPNGRFAYVTNQLGNSVSVISALSNTVVATIPVQSFPKAIAMHHSGAFAYVTTSGSNISVIDTATNTVVNSISVTFPVDLALSPTADLGYVTHSSVVNGVTVINTATNSVVTNIPLPADVTVTAAVSPDGAFVYVTCLTVGTGSKIAVIDTATNTLVTIVPLPGTFAPGVVFTPDGALAYVANNGGGVCCGGGGGSSSYSVIDTATHTEFARMPIGSPNGIAVTPDGAFVYITDLFDNTLKVVSTFNHGVAAIVPVGNFPQGVAIATLTAPPTPPPTLTERVEALIAEGALSQEQGAGLLDKIREATAKHEAGMTAAACNQLSSFINQVKAFIGNGTLTPAQGQPLIDAANAIKSDIGC
ncbi:MAG TPA: beta-propeller fold lactonase family protein [Pyrinomonadaceae bacterium]|nr:beta-propeller fold lactonase family protein [Pyrinomonadaceae bacterium]